MAKTKKKEGPKVVTFPLKIGKKSSTKATTLVERTIRCNGHMHKIGLTSKGQLWFANHDKAELEKFILMGDLGNNPCKCAVVLDAWRNGKELDESQVHDQFKRERIVPDRLARRLLRHKNKYRNWPDIDIVYGELQEPYEEKVQQSPTYQYTIKHTSKEQMAKFVGETVYKTLLHRGWPADWFDYDPRDGEIRLTNPGQSSNYNYQYGTLFKVHRSHGYTSPYVGGELLPDSTIKDSDTIASVPWRVFIDAAETYLLFLKTRTRADEQLLERKIDFTKYADNYIPSMGKLPTHGEISIDSQNGTVDFTIKHTGLTVQAANRLVNHYRETEDRANRLLYYNRDRRKQWFRVPAKPSKGLGALQKTLRTGRSVASRSLTDESYGYCCHNRA